MKYVELGWVLSDPSGRQSMAATLPSPERDLYLPPGKKASVLQETTLRLFSSNGQPANVQKMTGFISQVEFTDGKVWVPSRQNLESRDAPDMVAPSAEEQRLCQHVPQEGHRRPDRRAQEVLNCLTGLATI